jgi:hypothetical protein
MVPWLSKLQHESLASFVITVNLKAAGHSSFVKRTLLFAAAA